jgi:predicted dehydrogenase
MPRQVKVALIGCGNISEAYFAGCPRYDILQLTACADLDPARAQAKAEKHGVRACSVDELLADPEIEIIINLTIPQAHAPLNERILRAGKHAYTEKPFALDGRESRRVLALARRRTLLVGSAPDTFLGGGIQTARQLLDDGVIGRPLAATAHMLCRGHESWHPAPEFYYQRGGGPMFDMGPYYITALVNLLGPVRRVSGSTKASFSHRLITSQPLAGKKVKVGVPTHYSGTLDFADGTVATVIMSFDTWPVPDQPCIVIYGSEGTMLVPDPNSFSGPVRVRRGADKNYHEMPPHPFRSAPARHGRGGHGLLPAPPPAPAPLQWRTRPPRDRGDGRIRKILHERPPCAPDLGPSPARRASPSSAPEPARRIIASCHPPHPTPRFAIILPRAATRPRSTAISPSSITRSKATA